MSYSDETNEMSSYTQNQFGVNSWDDNFTANLKQIAHESAQMHAETMARNAESSSVPAQQYQQPSHRQTPVQPLQPQATPAQVQAAREEQYHSNVTQLENLKLIANANFVKTKALKLKRNMKVGLIVVLTLFLFSADSIMQAKNTLEMAIYAIAILGWLYLAATFWSARSKLKRAIEEEDSAVAAVVRLSNIITEHRNFP